MPSMACMWNMAGFLYRLTLTRDRHLATKPKRVEKLRDIFRSHCTHFRTASIAADLLAAWEIFLEFARYNGAITGDEHDRYWKRCLNAMEIVLHEQEDQQQPNDPVDRFITYLAGALLTGRVHAAALQGGSPSNFLNPSNTAAGWLWEAKTILVPDKDLPKPGEARCIQTGETR